MQCLTGDVCRLVRRKKYRRRGHLRTRAQALGRYPHQDGLALFLVEFVGHGAGDETGRDQIRGHAALGVLRGDRFDHPDHAGLARGVIGLTRIAGDADHGCDADHASKAAAHHAAHRRARQAERRGQIDGDDLIPILVAQLNQQVIPGYSSVGDEDVELIHGLFGLGHQRFDLILVRKVAGEHMHPLFERPRQLVKHRTPRAGDRNGRTLLMQCASDRPADAAARTGDERGLAGQIEHGRSPLPARFKPERARS